MESKQGFFSLLKDEVARGLKHSRSRPQSRSRSESPSREALALAPMSIRLPLSPLMEGPDAGDHDGGGGRRAGWGHWMRGGTASVRSDVRVLLGVMAAPMSPVNVRTADDFCRLSVKDSSMEASSARYILDQYIGVTGGLKLLSSIRNSYATGKVRMVALELETASKVVRNRHPSRDTESGAFVLWQMSPNMWYMELAVGDTNICAGCNGELIWRHTPWLGTRLAEGPVRPIRRALQGLDPLITAGVFANAQCVGEKEIKGEECYVLKLCADPETLEARSEAPVQVTRHILYGYFSVRTGFLIHVVDSCMTRVESGSFGDVVYWETTISSYLDDYRPVEGVMIAHSGQSTFTLYTFSDEVMSLTKMRMEESWTINEVAFNVHGLSGELFIPPAELCQRREGIQGKKNQM